MINFNGTIVSEDASILVQNRGFLYGDAVFETVKIVIQIVPSDSAACVAEDRCHRPGGTRPQHISSCSRFTDGRGAQQYQSGLIGAGRFAVRFTFG